MNFDPTKHALAELIQIKSKDWRINWIGPKGRYSTGISYRAQAVAEKMAEECGARKIVVA